MSNPAQPPQKPRRQSALISLLIIAAAIGLWWWINGGLGDPPVEPASLSESPATLTAGQATIAAKPAAAAKPTAAATQAAVARAATATPRGAKSVATATALPTPAATRASPSGPRAPPGLPVIAESELPPQALKTIALIERGGPFPYSKDGSVFQNREKLLPNKPKGYYREYTVVTPGSPDRGARRIVAGKQAELYYSDDHYASFSWVKLE